MWEDFIIHAAFGAIHAAIKNPAKAASLKEYFLKIADAIYETYSLAPPAHD